MAISALGLLKTRRLGPLCLTQACGAFNDNLVKNALVVLALFKLGSGGTGLTALAGVLIIAPFVLFSALAGQIADRFSKPRIIVLAKAAELLLMLGAAVAFITENQTALLALLFGLGTQAAVFGPLKYGILPEHLADSELVAGNGAIEATNFLSILLGTVAGGAPILFGLDGRGLPTNAPRLQRQVRTDFDGTTPATSGRWTRRVTSPSRAGPSALRRLPGRWCR